ncbi:MAG: transporter substrate-binding domain-containing protein [Alphaproteobacteria bacterium]|nr:transporter substrate-binding domain-containing protein [Alphaproteobacteria bacterium]
MAGAAVARPLDDVRQHGSLRVVVYSDFKPFSWLTPDGDVAGIDADIGRAIAEKLGLKAEIIARGAGEEVDDDIRSNIWQGPRTGGVKGDVMLHVPMDRELIARNNLAAISNAYYHEHVVLAVKADVLGEGASLDAFQEGKPNKVACQFATSAHYFLAFAQDGKLRNNVSPFVKFESAVENFLEGGSAGIMGRRAQIEAALDGKDLKLSFSEPEFPETLRSKWNVGTAVQEDSRDLGYAIGGAIRELRSSGELTKIFEKYGVSYQAPKRIVNKVFERPGYDPLPPHLQR